VTTGCVKGITDLSGLINACSTLQQALADAEAARKHSKDDLDDARDGVEDSMADVLGRMCFIIKTNGLNEERITRRAEQKNAILHDCHDRE
jgi:hypothetical protein